MASTFLRRCSISSLNPGRWAQVSGMTSSGLIPGPSRPRATASLISWCVAQYL